MKSSQNNWKVTFVWIATMSLIVSLILIYFCPTCTNGLTRGQPDRYVTFDSLAPYYYHLGLLSFVGCLVAGIIVLRTKQRVGNIAIAAVLAMMVSPIVVLFCEFRDAAPFNDLASLKDGSNGEYHLFYSSFLMGREIAIGKLVNHFGFRTTYHIVASGPGERMYGNLAVVRKEGAADEVLFALSPKKIIVGGLTQNMALVAYDVSHSMAYEAEINNNQHFVFELSPFLLLNSKDTPSQADFKDLMEPEYVGQFHQTVAPDLNNSNPKIREMARKYLKKYPAKPKEDSNWSSKS